MYIFPGLGLGSFIAQPKHIPASVICAAAQKLYEMVTPEDLAVGNLYPPLTDIRGISKQIAVRVIEECQVSGDCDPSLPKDRDSLLEKVRNMMWEPVYRDLEDIQREF
jgi:malic enzyme